MNTNRALIQPPLLTSEGTRMTQAFPAFFKRN